MKITVLTLILLISFSCSSNHFDWLCGSWVRTNDEEGYRTYEHWIKNSNTEYIGLGCTLQDGDTVFKENLRIIKTGKEWNLEVSGVNENPTLFLLINRTDNSFICENKLNEFPKLIEYSIEDSLLLAKISGGDREVSFSFQRE